MADEFPGLAREFGAWGLGTDLALSRTELLDDLARRVPRRVGMSAQWCADRSGFPQYQADDRAAASEARDIGGIRKDEGETLDHEPCGAALPLPLRHDCATSQLDSQ